MQTMIQVIPIYLSTSSAVRRAALWMATLGLLINLLVGQIVWPSAVHAAAATDSTATCGLTVEIISAPFAVTDSNKPGIEGPRVATLGARVRNSSGVIVPNVSVHIGNGVTPGVFATVSGGSLGMLDAKDSTHFLNDMGAGASVTNYWPLAYPATFDTTYPYTVWATTPSGCSASAATNITTQSEISASANKMLPKGAILQVYPSQVTPGGLINVQITGFQLGTIGQGPKPLSPEDAWFQPIGNSTFDPTCMRMVKSEVKLNSISSTPFVDQLYFSAISGYRSKAGDYVRYTFLSLRDCATTVRPYQEAASGTQEKYNDDFSAATSLITLATQGETELVVNIESDTPSINPGQSLRVSVDFYSTGSQIGYPGNGSPVVIESSIPRQTCYISASATKTVAADMEFSTDGGLTWGATEPVDACTITHLRWILQEPVGTTKGLVTYRVRTVDSYDGTSITAVASGGIYNAVSLTSSSATVNQGPTPTPTPTPSPTPTPDPIVQSGEAGGLESGPLPGDPSAFLGGLGAQDLTAASTERTPLAAHKARLLRAASFSLNDLMPTVGPNGTTPQAAVPVDVLAVTDVPDAQAVDFVDSTGQVRAVVLGIESLTGPYEHDYGVCNRFKSYSFDTIAPVLVDGLPGSAGEWFWRSKSSQGPDTLEEAFIFHIFVDETGHTFHIDSRWIQDDYPDTFAYRFDYVFNMQVWSGDLASSTALLQAMMTRLSQLDGGTWSIVYHNDDTPIAPQVFIQETAYAADIVQVTLRNLTAEYQSVHVYGSWRSYLDRNTDVPIDYTLIIPPGTSSLSLAFPGLLDVTLYTDLNGFIDKIYTGGGLWFSFSNSADATSTITPGICRSLDSIDLTDLLLAGCLTMTGQGVTQIDGVGMGRTLNPNGRPVDVSPYQAVRFWVKGDGTPVRIMLETAGITDGDYYQTVFVPGADWQQVIIPLSQFGQRGFGQARPFTGTDVKSLVWLNAEATSGTFTLSVDQASFTNNGLMRVESQPAPISLGQDQTITMVVEDGGSVQKADLFYSLDEGHSFTGLPMSAQQRSSTSVAYSGILPGQALGSEVRFYVSLTDVNGYVSRDPIDAPATFYRYRVDDRASLLVDDYAGLRLKNRLNGDGGIFNNPDASGQISAYRLDQELVLSYDVSAVNQFAGYFTELAASGVRDVSGYSTLNLLVRGEVGGEQLLVGLKDSTNLEPKINVGDVLPGGVTTEWRWVQIPLAAFPSNLNRSSLTSLSLSFAQSQQRAGQESRGQVHVKEIRFTGLVAPLVLDTFDDGNDLTNGLAQDHWTSAPGGSLTAVYANGDAQHSSGQSLRLDFNVPTGAYALWSTGLGGVNGSGAGLGLIETAYLTFWTKGSTIALPVNLYLSDGSKRAVVALADYATPTAAWQQVRIPLQDFVGQGVDPTHLEAFQIALEYGSGQGSLWIDNIMLGTAGAPQAERRTFHLADVDSRSLALHMPGGLAWTASSDAYWLSATPSGAGPDSLTIRTINLGLEQGDHVGHLTLSARNSAGETKSELVTVHLTITAGGAPVLRVFLPLVGR